MFTPYDEQLENDAASLAAAGTPEPPDPPSYTGVRDDDDITRARFPGGTVNNPAGSRYNRLRPVFSDSGITSLSGSLAASARPIHPDRMQARDSSQEVVVDNRPASFRPARVSTTVSNHDEPLDRNRVDEIFNRHTTRRFAF